MWFKAKFQPDLIDLVEYEKELLYQKKHYITLRPPSMIPDLIGGSWSASEVQAMRDNRVAAQGICSEISRVRIVYD